jgi:DNA-binding transcriptional MerR regulator
LSSDSSKEPKQEDELLRVGEVARRVGKTVRALHLYEELGLIKPDTRSGGGFRLYHPDVVTRINWIIKLQAIGFSLSQIQEFVRDFEEAKSGRSATTRVREEFRQKLDEVRRQIKEFEVIENDLVEAIDYLESCNRCSPRYAPEECGVCDHQGHEPGDAPNLFYPLARGVNPTAGVPSNLVKLSVVRRVRDES